MHVLLHSAFQKACDLEMIRRNPINFVQPPKAVRKEIEIFTTEELHAILDALQGDKNLCRFYPVVLLAMNTGMRKGEVLGLLWYDVDLKQSTVFIRQQVQSLAQGGSHHRYSQDAGGEEKDFYPPVYECLSPGDVLRPSRKAKRQSTRIPQQEPDPYPP